MSKKPQRINMEKHFSWQVTLLPILFIILTAGVLSALNILDLQKEKDKQIEKVTTEFIDQQKRIAKARVVTASELIRFQSHRTEDLVRKRVKERVDEVIHISSVLYEKYYRKYSEEELKEQIKLILSNAVFDHPDGYFFAVDMNTEKIIIHQLENLVGYSMSQHKDLRGKAVLSEQKELLSRSDGAFQTIYFSKPTAPDKEFPKQLYVRYFKPFNWLIGTGEYIDDMEKRLQEDALKRFSTLYAGYKDDLFIEKIHSLEDNDGKPYGAMILSSNPDNGTGQPLFATDQDSKGNYYRKDILKLLRDHGEGFASYWHPSPEHGSTVKKTSFFFYDKGWSWAIGSGFYYDTLDVQLAEIEQHINEKVIKDIRAAITITLLIITVMSSIFFMISRSISRTIHNYSTKLQQSLRKTEQALDDLNRRNRALQQFNYTASHELRTPLVTIESFLGYLKNDLAEQNNAHIDEDIRHIGTATRRMGQLLDSLTHVFRAEKITSPETETELLSLLQKITQEQSAPLQQVNAVVRITAGNLVLRGDLHHLQTIWKHLLTNAVKFIGDQPQPVIEIGTLHTEAGLVFFVRDNGIGIEAQYQEKIFGLFDQLDNQAEGLGLGLALVRQIVELYGGRIWVESAGAGQGCCFYFTLPGANISA